MTFSMIFIDEVQIDGIKVRFFEGIDFDELINHPKNGSKGFIFCFIDNWVNDIKTYNRQNKIKSIVNNTDYKDFDWEDINNNYIAIYQSDGIGFFEMYKTIRQKVERKQFDIKPWTPIGGLGRGAWQLTTRKNSD